MLSCQKSCLLCDLFQVYKVNFSKIHGFCTDHQTETNSFQTCIHCNSIIMILSLTEIENFPSPVHKANPIQPKKTFFKDSEGSKLCDFCLEPSSLSQTLCHHICQVCFTGKCPMWTHSICQNCQSPCILNNLSCGHCVCEDCNADGCELCNQELYFKCFNQIVCEGDKEKCEYCKEKESFFRCENGHKICSDCKQEICPLCVESIKIVQCASCGVKAGVEMCTKLHFVCLDCRNDCALCGGDVFSLQTSVLNLGNSDGSMGRMMSAASGSYYTNRMKRMSAESQSWARDPVINEESVNKTQESSYPKKKVRNGTGACSKCNLL